MREKFGDVLWGIAFVAIGIGFAGNAFHFWNFKLFFDGWWTLFIIIPCLISMIQNGVNTGNLIGLIVGILLFINANGFLPMHLISKLLFPCILIIVGLNIIFKGSFKNSYKIKIEKNYIGKDGYLSITSVFSNHQVRPVNQNVNGGAASAVFGNIQIDLRNAIINQDINFNITSIMGGVEVFIPSNVNVRTSSIPILGGVSNNSFQSNLENSPTIYINATCILGGVDIK